MKPMDERQLGVMQQYVDRGYGQVCIPCAKGRKMSKERVKAIAEGRVWDGIMARRIGLVDSLGGLDKAVGLDWPVRPESLTGMRWRHILRSNLISGPLSRSRVASELP